MKRFIYMNHRIRAKAPAGPVIAVQVGKRVRNTNRVQLVHEGRVVAEARFEPRGLSAAPHHQVRAFVEVLAGVELKFPRAA